MAELEVRSVLQKGDERRCDPESSWCGLSRQSIMHSTCHAGLTTIAYAPNFLHVTEPPCYECCAIMISSAVGGKRAAPKAAARRRAPTKSQPVLPAEDAPPETRPPSSPAPANDAARDTTSVTTATSALILPTVVASSASDIIPRVETPRGALATSPAVLNSQPICDDRGQPGADDHETAQPQVLSTAAAEISSPAQRVKPRARPLGARRNKRRRALSVIESGHGIDSQERGSPHPENSGPKKQQRKARKTRGANVSDIGSNGGAAAGEVDPANFTMFELSYSSKHGERSEREKKMADIDWAEVSRKRQEEVERIQAGQKVDKSNADQVAESADPTDRPIDITPASQLDGEEATGIGLRIVNGQIVEDETTLSIDQTAQAHANANNDDEVEEENDLAERLNRTTYLNDRRRDPRERIPVYKSKSDPWTEDETDRFYDALRMFGTDFDIISKMFPPKTRMQVKKKFNREERIDLARINAALLGKENKPMDLEHYAREVGEDVSVYMKYESYEHASQIIRESMKEREEELAAALKENTETQRQQDIQQKQQEAVEKKKLEKKEKAAARRANKGRKPGLGTMGGGGPEEVVVETTER
nr:transcription factor tfiiib component b'' [Quercus suber]